MEEEMKEKNASYQMKLSGPKYIIEQAKKQCEKIIERQFSKDELLRQWAYLFLECFEADLREHHPQSQVLIDLTKPKLQKGKKRLGSNDLRACLLAEGDRGDEFKRLWKAFLTSQELQGQIQRKVKVEEKKQAYLKLIAEIIEESDSANPFKLFRQTLERKRFFEKIPQPQVQFQIQPLIIHPVIEEEYSESEAQYDEEVESENLDNDVYLEESNHFLSSNDLIQLISEYQSQNEIGYEDDWDQ